MKRNWKFVDIEKAYRMYGFPTKHEFYHYLGTDSFLIPIHYDMCASEKLCKEFLDAEDQCVNENDPTIDCFHDPVDNTPIEFTLKRPIIKTIREFLTFHNE